MNEHKWCRTHQAFLEPSHLRCGRYHHTPHLACEFVPYDDVRWCAHNREIWFTHANPIHVVTNNKPEPLGPLVIRCAWCDTHMTPPKTWHHNTVYNLRLR